jgi:hypothetical protein
MKGIPTLRPRRLKQAAVLAGVSALVAAGMVLGGAQAFAANPVADVGNGQDTLGVSPGTAGSPTSGSITWSSSACPTGNQGSAKILLVDPLNTSSQVSLSGNIAGVNQAFTDTSASGTGFELDVAAAGLADSPFGDIAEVVVECNSTANGLTGTHVFTNDAFLSFSASGTTYTAVPNPGVSGPPVSVNLTLTANPNPATSGQSVTLIATASAANATGTVTFLNGATSLGTAPLSGGATSTASLPFTAPTETVTTNVSLTATYNPTGNFTAGTGGALSLPVQPPPVNPVSATGTIPLAVTVPLSGTFTLSVNSTTWVVLGVNTAGTTGTAATTPIVVTDTYNSYPGWSVTGEATQWNGVTNTTTQTPSGYPAATDIPADHGSQHIAADQLGWAPTNTGTLPTGVTLGGTIAPATSPNGLGDAFQPLATGAPGVGSFTGAGGVTLGANLTLAIPAGQEEGPYAAFLNIDAMSGTP